MISESISDNIPPQMKISNMVFPIVMPFCSFVSNWSVTSHMCDLINDVKQNVSDSRIYCCKILMLSKQMSCYKSKCIIEARFSIP